jgi:hypothetical protein
MLYPRKMVEPKDEEEMDMRCIVFTNFRRQSGNEFKDENDEANQQEQWEKQLLPYQKCPEISIIYIFIIDAYQAMMAKSVAFKAMMIENRMRKVLVEAGKNVQLEKKIQIVGTKELIPILAKLQTSVETKHEELNDLLLGGGQHVYYDSPKFAEAIIRIARGKRSNQELILRFDEDVSVNHKGIDELLQFYEKFKESNIEEQEKFCFFSGNYRIHKSEDLLNDYAIRTQFFTQPGKDVHTLRPFETGYSEAKQWLDSIATIGVDPKKQVISGAGLGMSDASIQILPPFAKADSQIIWIDDHLKRRLHEALGHLPVPPKDKKTPRCCNQAKFAQDRYPDGVMQKDIDWIKDYLPRLMRGIVMDNLIWDHKQNRAGKYVPYVKNIIDRNPLPDKVKFNVDLIKTARQTLDTIINSWAIPQFSGFPLYTFISVMNNKDKDLIINQVIEDLYNYLVLLQIWPSFVTLIKKLDARENKWIFRNK